MQRQIKAIIAFQIRTIMPYSISTYCLIDLPLVEALDNLAPHTKHVEMMSNEPNQFHERGLYESYSFKYSLHAPLSVDNTFVDIAASDEAIRARSVHAIVKTFRIASDLSASVVVHPGFFNENDPAGKNYQISLAELRSASREYGVFFLIENLAPELNSFFSSPTDQDNHQEQLFCLDIGHANLCGNLNHFLDLPFDHIHLHDNDGMIDTHSPIGDGCIDFDHVMRRVREQRIAAPVIEVKTFEGALRTLHSLTKRYGQ